MVLPGHQVNLVLLVNPVLLEHRACLDHLDKQDPPVLLVNLVLPERRVLMVLLV
jgi:hypothetical protein